MQQTTSEWVTIHDAEASLPLPASKTDDTFGGSIAELLQGGRSSGKLEIWLEAADLVTLSSVAVLLFEDGEWGRLAQAGDSDSAFADLVLRPGLPTRFAVYDVGRPTRAAVSATFAGTTVTVRVKAIHDV